MARVDIDGSTLRRPLRLWPGVALAALLAVLWFVVPAIAPGAMLVALIGGFASTLAILLWWLFFSRAPWAERVGAVVLAIVAMVVTYRFLHVSVARGNMGYQFILLAVPILGLAFVVGAALGRRLPDGPRRATMAAAILLACGAWTLLRSEGVTGDGMAELTWRWTKTPEERLLAAAGDEPTPITAAQAAPAPAGEAPPEEPPPVETATIEVPPPAEGGEATTPPASPVAAESAVEVAPEARPQWPGLRGPDRDGVVAGLSIETDWTRSPPALLWRRSIGPGVSSFAVRGDVLYTQEQRGDDEIVSAYDVATGEPRWMHRDAVRFWDAHVGAGPRATPALADGRVYTLGATGILNALDADDGTVVWSRDAAADAGAKLPTWGFTSSPLVVDDLLVVQAGSLLAYELATGEPGWVGPPERGSYSSPHLLTLGGVPQIVLVASTAAISVSPADGTLLWEHPWSGFGILQPVRIAGDDLLISMIDSAASPMGMQRLAVDNGPTGWTVEERWTSTRLKPSFSALVAHEGHAYGFDGSILACIDLETGERKWKGGRFGEGQLLLLPDQDLLLVVSEQGEMALVQATADRFTELARMPVLAAKTWNQPALVGDVLLVRNGEEMAALRLPRASE